MRTFTNFTFYLALSLIMLITYSITFTQQSNNNAFVFNGESSRVFIEDGLAVNQGEANQNAFQYFNKENSENNNISVQAWIYLIGENLGTKMPIIFRAVEGGYESFSLYIDVDGKGYFSINGEQGIESVSTPEIPAFTWIQLTGIYDADNKELKIYYGKDLEGFLPEVSLGTGYVNGQGLFIGKSGADAFKGLIDEIRLWNIALGENNINGSGGNGNPAEPFPNSLAPYFAGQWSFNEIGNYGGTEILEDFSDSLNHLRVDNINEIILSNGFSGEVDVMSIDIDGNDYWIWRSLEVVSPCIVVIETHVEFGLRNLVVPYDKDYMYPGKHPDYHGASPVAMAALAKDKGYRLVGANRFGFNAFYIRNDLVQDLIPEIEAAQTLEHDRNKKLYSVFEAISHFEYREH